MKNIIVLYHGHCPDGSAAAAVAYKKFAEDAEYIPVSDRNNPPEEVTSREDKNNIELYILDFCYPAEMLASLKNDFKKVVVIDHHISVQDYVKVLDEYVFDLDHSGASLTYKYLFGEEAHLPEFIKIIEISDLHRDKENVYGNIMNYINSCDYEVSTYVDLINNFEKNKNEYESNGKAIERYVKLLQELALDKYDIVELGGVVMPALNMNFDMNTRSRILAEMYRIMPPVSMCYRYHEGMWKVGLRSNGDFDCAAFAAKYGGGGHKGSAGFAIVDPEGKIFFKLLPKENKS